MPAWTLNERATLHRLFGLHGYEKDDEDWHQIYVAVTSDKYRNTTVISDDYKHRWKNGKSKMYRVNICKRVDQLNLEELPAYNFARDGVNREAKRMGIDLPPVRGHDDQIAQANQASQQQVATNAIAPRRALGSRRPRQESIGENITVAQPKQTFSHHDTTGAVATPRAPTPKKPVATLPAVQKKNVAAASTNQVSPQQVITGTAAPKDAYMTKRREREFSSSSDLSSIDSDHEEHPRLPTPRKPGSTRPAVHGNVTQGARTDHIASQQVDTVAADTPRVPISTGKKIRPRLLNSYVEETQERSNARHGPPQIDAIVTGAPRVPVSKGKKREIVQIQSDPGDEGMQDRNGAPHSPQQGGRNAAAPVSTKLPDSKKQKITDDKESGSSPQASVPVRRPGTPVYGRSFAPLTSKAEKKRRKDEDEIMREAGEEAAVKTVLEIADNASADAFHSMVDGMMAIATSKAEIAPREAGSAEVGATGQHSVTNDTTRATEASTEPARPKKSHTTSNSLPFFEELNNVSPQNRAARKDWRRANLDRILLEPFHDPFVQESKSSKKSSSRQQVPVQPAPQPIAPKERVLNFFNDMFNGELSKEYISSVFDRKQSTEEPGRRLEHVFNMISKEASKTSIKCRYELRNVFISPKSPFSNFLLATAAFGHGLQMLHTSDVKFFGYSPSTPIACAKVRGSYHIAPEKLRLIDHDDLVFKRGGRVYKLYIRQQDCAVLGADKRTNTAYVSMDVMLCQAFDCPKCSNVEDHGDPRVSISSLPRVHMRNLGNDNEFVSPVIPLWRKHKHEKDEEEKFLIDLSYGTLNVKFWDGNRQPVAMCHKAECGGCLEAAEVTKK
jgi:hypothetical protein